VERRVSSEVSNAVDIKFLEKLMFHAVVVQAIVGGLVAGKMSEAKLGAGLKHVLILLVIGFVSFLIWVWRV